MLSTRAISFLGLLVAFNAPCTPAGANPVSCKLAISGAPESGAWALLKNRFARFLDRSLADDELAAYHQSASSSAGVHERLYIVHEGGPEHEIHPGRRGKAAAELNSSGDVRFGFAEVGASRLAFFGVNLSVALDRDLGPVGMQGFVDDVARRFEDLEIRRSGNSPYLKALPRTMAVLEAATAYLGAAPEVKVFELEIQSYAGGISFGPLVRIGPRTSTARALPSED